MGFVMLGISTLTAARHQRRPVRHGRPRSDHRHALLPRRLGEGALPHARDQAAQRPAHADAASSAGSSASAPWPRSVCPASPGSGASSRPSCSAYSPAPGLSVELFRTLHGHRRARHRARRRLPAVAVPAHRVRRADRRVRRPAVTPTAVSAAANDERSRQRHPRRERSSSGSPGLPLLIAIVVFGVYPQLMFKVIDPAVTELVKVVRDP